MKTVIEITREAGLHLATDVNWMPIIGLEYAERFAALVAAAAKAEENEACAKLIESYGLTLVNGVMLTEAIRARSNT